MQYSTIPHCHRRIIEAGSAVLFLGLAACDGESRRLDAAAGYLAGAPAAPSHLASCQASGASHELPTAIKESSGLARSLRDPGLFWTHNDAGNRPVVFAVTERGELAARVTIEGARHVDWEDIDIAPCGDGNCLYIGDIGDNDGKRNSVTIYRVREPADGARTAQVDATINARYPDGARDAEAMFIHSGNIYIVTKGREGPIELYGLSGGSAGTGITTMKKIREIFPEPKTSDDRITSASASPDGRWVAIRSYRTLYLFPSQGLIDGSAANAVTSDLKPLREPKGEGLAIANDGSVWLSSEADGKRPPAISQMKCNLAAAGG